MRRLLAGAVFMALAALLVAFDAPDVVVPKDRPDNVGRLGIAVLPLARHAAKTLKPHPRGGAVVVSLERMGPAARAGLRVGDVIVRFNGRAVSDGSELARLTMTARTGSPALLEFMRNGELRHAALAVGKPPANKIYV